MVWRVFTQGKRKEGSEPQGHGKKEEPKAFLTTPENKVGKQRNVHGTGMAVTPSVRVEMKWS